MDIILKYYALPKLAIAAALLLLLFIYAVWISKIKTSNPGPTVDAPPPSAADKSADPGRVILTIATGSPDLNFEIISPDALKEYLEDNNTISISFEAPGIANPSPLIISTPPEISKEEIIKLARRYAGDDYKPDIKENLTND